MVDYIRSARCKWGTTPQVAFLPRNETASAGGLTRLLGEVNAGEYVEPSKQTVSAFLERWLVHMETHVARKTFDRYREIANTHLLTAFGSIPLGRLNAADIDAAYSVWLKSGRRRGQGGLSAQTVLHHHRVLRQALAQAVKWGLLARNPADAVDPPRRVRPEIRALDSVQLKKLLEAAEGTRLLAPIYLAIVTGMRRGELLGLQWGDLDSEVGVISVRRSIEQTRDGIATKSPKSGRSRAVSLAADTLELLRKHRIAQNAERLKLGSAYQSEDRIFPREDGSVWEPELFGKAFSAVAKRAAIGHVRLHDLRHACASLMLKSGVHAKVVSERLGHSTISITLDLYSHVLPGLQEAAAAKLDQLLKSARPGSR